MAKSELSGAAFLKTEIARGRLQSIVDEAGSVLIHTAFSMGIREAKDFSCAVLTPDGRTVTQSHQSIPMFIGTLTHTVQALLEVFPPAQWRLGDVMATNDPWLGTGHLFDLTLVKPVFTTSGHLIGFASVVAHLSDIGGRGFGLDSKDIFEEGFQIPPIKIVDAGSPNVMFRHLLASNVRLSDQVLGDVDAMLSTLGVIEHRLGALAEELSDAALLHIYADLDHRAEAYMREAIGRLPSGSYQSVFESEPIMGTSFVIKLVIRVHGETLEVDFDGSSKQVPAAINACYSYSCAYVVYAMKCLLAPDVPFTAGLTRPIRVVAPEGTIVNSRFPAGGVARNLVGQFIPGMIFGALAKVAPSLAECGAPRPTCRIIGAGSSAGMNFSVPFFVMGGLGARPNKDGIACLAFPTNTETVPVEIIETSSPLFVEQKELVADSGGAGQFRGGLGQRIVIRCLAEVAQAFVVAQRLHKPPRGSRSGMDGSVAKVAVRGLPVMNLSGSTVLHRGDTISLQSPGGGGFGSPKKRRPNLVASDIRNGYVTKAMARIQYGWDPKTDLRIIPVTNSNAPTKPRRRRRQN
jgi:N-methylhydantoinase B